MFISLFSKKTLQKFVAKPTNDVADEEGEEVVEQGAHEVAREGELNHHQGPLILIGHMAKLDSVHQELVHCGRASVGEVPQHWPQKWSFKGTVPQI